MSLKFFVVPVHYSEPAEEALNGFLRSRRILAVERQFVDLGENSFWAVCVDYQPGPSTKPEQIRKGRIDYRELLPPEQFNQFVKLRNMRAHLAQREAVPLYTVFTNEQLAHIVTKNVQTVAELSAIQGIGDARVSKYGQAVLDALAEKIDEENR